jgi:ATP-dependent DNA helicase RecG
MVGCERRVVSTGRGQWLHMPTSLDALIEDPTLLLTLAEDQWFERKGIGAAPRDIAKALVAFANAEGGLLAVGVSARDGLGGIRANPGRVNEIRQAALNFTEPPVRHVVHLVPCRDRQEREDEVLILEVEPSEQMHRLTDGSTWLRVGDETRELDLEQALQLSYDKGISQFDGETVPDASLDDLDLDAVEAYREALASALEPREILSARGLYRDQGARRGVTWAGVLVFGQEPTRFFPNAYLRIVRYEGARPETGERLNISHDAYLEGAIPTIIGRVRAELPTLLRGLTRLGRDGRFEQVAEYPESVWLEAVVNALVHRSYALRGDHVRLLVFDDRIEVESPGRLPGLVRPENIRTTRYSRNPRIARVLTELGYVRELGEGVDRMFEEMAAAGLPEPVFRQEAASVRVILYNDRAQRQRRLIAGGLPEPLIPLIEALWARQRVTTAEAARLLGVSRPTALRYLAQLGEQGLIERVATSPRDPTAYWRLRDPERG